LTARGRQAESNPGTDERREVGAVPPHHQSPARFQTASQAKGHLDEVALRLFGFGPLATEVADPGDRVLTSFLLFRSFDP